MLIICIKFECLCERDPNDMYKTLYVCERERDPNNKYKLCMSVREKQILKICINLYVCEREILTICINFVCVREREILTICIKFVCLCERDDNNMYKLCMSV